MFSAKEVLFSIIALSCMNYVAVHAWWAWCVGSQSLWKLVLFMLNNRLDLNGNHIILVVIYFKYNGSCAIRNW